MLAFSFIKCFYTDANGFFIRKTNSLKSVSYLVPREFYLNLQEYLSYCNRVLGGVIGSISTRGNKLLYFPRFSNKTKRGVKSRYIKRNIIKNGGRSGT